MSDAVTRPRGTLLVVDDEKAILRAFENVFHEDRDLEILSAGSADEALDILSRRLVDLVVSDQMMPGTDGVTLLSRVRRLYPDIPSMILTGIPDFEPPPELAGTPVLAKPWDTKDLRRTIRARIGCENDEEEQALLQLGVLSAAQLERARRIRDRLHRRRPLGELLVELGELTRDQYERIVQSRRARMGIVDLLKEDGYLGDEDFAAYKEAKRKAPGLSDRALLVEAKLVTEEQFLRALSVKHGVPYLEPEVGSVDLELLSRTSFRYLLRHHALPVRVVDRQLVVILADPLDNALRLELERIFGMPIEPRCCAREKIVEALRTLENLRGHQDDESALSLQYHSIEDVSGVEETGEEAVKIVDYLLARSIQLGASDLHIEPLQAKVRVRVRVDGVLQQLTDLPAEVAPRIVSRVKILASADIAEKRQHQDGKIFVRVDGREIDIRMSSYVSVHGETLVLRLLDRNRGLVPLTDIGFQPTVFTAIDEVVLRASSGLVLVTGPTGSGKTTTLYSFIDHANDPTEKVITCEDPVEYVLDGVIQCSVNAKSGPTFADSLRAIVRQDPDTIVVGEVRDETTVGLALEAALTGHKVFATFHTEDAVGAFVRLLEMGAEPFLVSSTVAAIVAQRLVRRLCPRCKKPQDPTRAELRFLGLDRTELRGQSFQGPVGCGRCSGSGFRGRLAIHEVLLPDDDFRDAVLQRAPAKELRRSARRLPEFLTLQEDGLLKAVEGLTTLEEIIGNAPRDTAARPLGALRAHLKPGRSE